MVIGDSSTNELVWELQDQVQRVERKVNWLVTRAGGNPEEIGALPAEDDAPEHAEAA